ncbi:bile acid:sodium symporter family protein [Paraburkholderia sp. RL17-373-BIF-A]|uniref:bile acid:sodium symporter family protein n=1 Tax=Paraburkholderia sp. RL17-373-BIF-A TaxID=3031629 RepID=UPI0038B6C7F5
MARSKILPHTFTLFLVGAVCLASLLPVHGRTALAFNWVTNAAVGLLFFLHGTKLSRKAVITGVTNWRLHLVVLASTFAFFPILGLALKPLLLPLITPALYAGVLFVCTLPSTVQSSIALTSIAKGNVPAAVCSASASSLLGIFITPWLAGLMVADQVGGNTFSWHTVRDIVWQLFIPFVVGQALRPMVGQWMESKRGLLKCVDQGSILLVVYGAFSEAVNAKLWHQVSLGTLGGLLVTCFVLLALGLLATLFVSSRLHFNRADRIVIVLCGSKKSLAAGVPMAKVIFAAHALGPVLLPLMLFHQVQLIICSLLAHHWGADNVGTEEN